MVLAFLSEEKILDPVGKFCHIVIYIYICTRSNPTLGKRWDFFGYAILIFLISGH